MTYAIIWEFLVPVHRIADFEEAYGPDGPWAHLFKRAPGFVDVELLRCKEQVGRYMTIDRWATRDAFEDFKRVFAADYQSLDARLEGLASTERRLGGFDECTGA